MPNFKDWINTINRGGLCHCKATFFLFLHSLEIATKVAITEGVSLKKGLVERAKKKLKGNEDVLFWWECTVTRH